ncbi:MAG: sigma-70 family RNA polymerase sigma factor [Verrucomicrobiota bacterium]
MRLQPSPEGDPERLRDLAWMQGIQNGDQEAFRELILEYQSRVAGVIARMAGSSSDAEELTHEVFVRVWRSAHRYQPSAKLSTWLLTIARNLVLNEIRYRQRHPTISRDIVREDGQYPEDSTPDTTSVPPDAALLESELQQAIDDALQQLPENQRTALVLQRFEALSYEEIATLLDVSVPAVKSLLFRARTTLRELLKDYLN